MTMYKDQEYTALLKLQIETLKKENRFLEFKSNCQEADKLGRYISALSNGACLDNEETAYLYFGVEDETLEMSKFTRNYENFMRKQEKTRIWNYNIWILKRWMAHS